MIASLLPKCSLPQLGTSGEEICASHSGEAERAFGYHVPTEAPSPGGKFWEMRTLSFLHPNPSR